MKRITVATKIERKEYIAVFDLANCLIYGNKSAILEASIKFALQHEKQFIEFFNKTKSQYNRKYNRTE